MTMWQLAVGVTSGAALVAGLILLTVLVLAALALTPAERRSDWPRWWGWSATCAALLYAGGAGLMWASGRLVL